MRQSAEQSRFSCGPTSPVAPNSTFR